MKTITDMSMNEPARRVGKAETNSPSLGRNCRDYGKYLYEMTKEVFPKRNGEMLQSNS